ncbi:hypothetical protein [Rhizobium rhizogenes]|uniref:hypothetical protein n=1 Tax=Rhizobium rhizogenes TaxID=359 RepID=UPI0004D49517|nr:hypothetical protein [Rhizobium rhizogenes]KEA07470.1 hypothetical protein CN09_11200 [Rhizobium rhizogenes]NTJ22260.1 hypothetical protein [Rhizobium rhizogenes]QUE80977.1 hypothetical protein EML492_03975 [Rhizobium rhizogenes]TQO80917.1 hypothetical protein FFE80_07425 [Rhizobium rhizogenes]TRB51511.1 hypothetical protein EXN69_26310 [Rhizobium rhizogenes]
MSGADLIAAIGPMVPVIGLILTIWWRVEGKIDGARDKADKAEKYAVEVERKLAASQLHNSETFATKAGMQEQTAQLLRAIEGVGNRIDGLHERLDRAFERTTRTTTRG